MSESPIGDSLPDEQTPDELLDRASALAKDGDYDGALEIAHLISDPRMRSTALLNTAVALADEADAERAISVTWEALDAAARIERLSTRVEFFEETAAFLGRLGYVDEEADILRRSVALLSEIVNPETRAIELTDMAHGLARRDHPMTLEVADHALAAIQRIRRFDRGQHLSNLLRGPIRRGDDLTTLVELYPSLASHEASADEVSVADDDLADEVGVADDEVGDVAVDAAEFPEWAPSPTVPTVSAIGVRLHSDAWAAGDELGYSLYATAIATFLRHRNTSPPLTVGVLAPWGQGKTTLMRMVQRQLEDRRAAGDYADVRISSPALRQAQRSNGLSYPGQLVQAAARSFRRFTNAGETSDEPAVDPPTATFGDLQDWIDEDLASTSSAGSDGNGLTDAFRLGGFPTIWFNAWKYQSSEQVWAGLAHGILSQLVDRLPSRLHKERF